MRFIRPIFVFDIYIIFIFSTVLLSQNLIDRTKLKSDFALKENRIKYKNELNLRIKNVFNNELNSESEENWQNLFREIGLIYYKSGEIHDAIEKATKNSPSGSIQFIRSLVETILILYPNEFSDYIRKLWETTHDPTLFAYCSHYLEEQNDTTNINISDELKKRFSDWQNIPQLKYLNYYLENSEVNIPDLREIFSHNFLTGKTIIYSIHRKNRSYSGITIIKNPDGTFVNGENDSIFYVKQLARSVSGLPGYLSQGDTPQGIFSIVGFYVSPTESIGPTANVLTRIPFEVSTKLFYHGRASDNDFILKDYYDLLPGSWKEYFPIYESFYAGKTGRRKIVMHGSVDDLNFYKDQVYFPLTPSKGCLTTVEIWSEENGKNIRSDQSELMNAFFSTGQLEGFLVVINIDDKEQNVTIDEIIPYIEK